MTQAQAQAVTAAIINAGYEAQATQVGGNWRVHAKSGQNDSFIVDVQAAANLATNQGVLGFIAEIEYR